MFAGKLPLGILGHLSSKHRRTPEIVLSKGHASFRITSSSPVQRIAADTGSNDFSRFEDIPEAEAPTVALLGPTPLQGLLEIKDTHRP